MKWEKLGLIFDAETHGFQYAKSPQAIVFDGYVRIFFSACRPDKDKLISYPAFVDFDLDLRMVLRTSSVLMPAGGLGCFDEHGIFPISPVRVGENIYAYTTGWSRRCSVSVETAIGLAISEDDGEHFVRFGTGPVMACALHEPFLVADAFVRHFGGLFHMWYIFGTDWASFEQGKEPDRVYKIAHATSSDGINWQRNACPIIPDLLEHESQALPSVVYRNGFYHMVFCYRHSSDFRTNQQRSYRLGYARSANLQDWVRDDEALGFSVLREDWESEMQCYPCFVEIGNAIYLLYNGNKFGKYGFGAARLLDV